MFPERLAWGLVAEGRIRQAAGEEVGGHLSLHLRGALSFMEL